VTSSASSLPPDAVDVPVQVDQDQLHGRTNWRWADWPWPSSPEAPLEYGWYRATTTWRHILQSAFQNGGDPDRWLREYPDFAAAELARRAAGLRSMLYVKKIECMTEPGAANRALFVTPLYQHGVEASGKTGFAYELGMTMAHWITVVMSGLSGTKHLELETPPDMAPARRGRLPDLWGWHAGEDMNWLIEAKAGRQLGGERGPLASGWEQLSAGSARMGSVRHRKVLCGALLPGRTH
jgi:hypothetical protein